MRVLAVILKTNHGFLQVTGEKKKAMLEAFFAAGAPPAASALPKDGEAIARLAERITAERKAVAQYAPKIDTSGSRDRSILRKILKTAKENQTAIEDYVREAVRGHFKLRGRHLPLAQFSSDATVSLVIEGLSYQQKSYPPETETLKAAYLKCYKKALGGDCPEDLSYGSKDYYFLDRARQRVEAMNARPDGRSISYEAYVQAQFEWFLDAFRTVPRPSQLGTAKAEERALQYLKQRFPL